MFNKKNLDALDCNQIFLDLQIDDLEKQQSLLPQIQSIDLNVLKKQQALILNPLKEEKASFESYQDFCYLDQADLADEGLNALKEGLMGCLIVAGGQASRLGLGNTPKGKCRVTFAKNKTLFQLIAEKTVSASKMAQKKLSIAFMTSPLNDRETKEYFKENNYFGLSEEQVDFYCQSTLPFLDYNGSLFLETDTLLAQGPDGNGDSLKNFYLSGIWNKWQKLGIKYVNFILIDNPLADPFDVNLLGTMVKNTAEVTIKAVQREHVDEKVGVIVKDHNKIKVVEYTELLESEKSALDNQGKFKHLLANISLFCFSMDFVKKVAHLSEDQIPLHAVKKKVKKLGEDSYFAWKFERFIFDLLPFADQISTIVYPRNKAFAPLKNFSGPDSMESVQAALQQLEREIYYGISGVNLACSRFELSQDFYYPTEELKKKWLGRLLPDQLYIEP